MYISSIIFFVAITTFARISVATPPACLLAALQTQPSPADLTALCGTLVPQLAGNITQKCSGDASKSAIAVYLATCSAKGVTISIPTQTASGTQTGAGGSSPTGTQSSGSSTGTGSSASPSPTKNAGSITSSRSTLTLETILLGGLLAGYIL